MNALTLSDFFLGDSIQIIKSFLKCYNFFRFGWFSYPDYRPFTTTIDSVKKVRFNDKFSLVHPVRKINLFLLWVWPIPVVYFFPPMVINTSNSHRKSCMQCMCTICSRCRFATQTIEIFCSLLTFSLNQYDLKVVFLQLVFSFLREQLFYCLQRIIRNVRSIHWKPEKRFRECVFFDGFGDISLAVLILDQPKFYEPVSLNQPWNWSPRCWGSLVLRCYLFLAFQLCGLLECSAESFPQTRSPSRPRCEIWAWSYHVALFGFRDIFELFFFFFSSGTCSRIVKLKKTLRSIGSCHCFRMALPGL